MQSPNLAESSNKKSKKVWKIIGIILGAIVLAVIIVVLLTPQRPTVNKINTIAQYNEAEKVYNWDSQYGDVFTTLNNALQKIATDSSNQNMAAVSGACKQLQSDISNYQSDQPIPDTAVEEHWSSALSYFGSGAGDCIEGAANTSSNKLNQASSEFEQGNKQLNSAISAIKNL